MNAEVKKKWVAALRSGKYTQIEGRLKTDKGHCCLGVLCELAVKEKVIAPAKKTSEGWSFARNDTGLPRSVKRWSGLGMCGGDPVTIKRDHTLLSNHNDRGRTFAEIADAIEKQL